MTPTDLLKNGFVETKPGNFVRKEYFPTKPGASVKRADVTSDEAGLNRLEAAWLAEMRLLRMEHIGIQNHTLKLAFNCRYTPDFSAAGYSIARLDFFEVKGPHAWEDSIIKLKVAARVYPFFQFWMVTRPKGSGWQIVEVKP